MPGVHYSSNSKFEAVAPARVFESSSAMHSIEAHRRDVYYNPRLDPKNYLEGPLAPNPSTRLRQMLARPGIIVGTSALSKGTLSQQQKIAPGICDGISARCALEAGFTCMYQRYGSRKETFMLLA